MATPLRLFGLGSEGLDLRSPREQLPPTKAAVLNNVRPFQGKIESTPGITALVTPTLGGRPLAVRPWLGDDMTWRAIFVTHTKVYSLNVATGVVTDITPTAGFSGSPNGPMDAAIASNLLIVTNGQDAVYKWDYTTALAVALGGSPPKANTVCAALSYVLLGALATNLRRIQWSDTALPETWTGGDSGNLTLYQAPGDILRLLPLGEVVIAYRRDNIHLLFYVGPPFIWAQRQITTGHGLIAWRAIADLGERHLYWGTDNVYLFDGASRIPVADDVFDTMITSFDVSNQDNIHAGVDYQNRKVYFFYPKLGNSGICKDAWVFDYGQFLARGKLEWHRENYGATGITAAGNFRTLTGTTWGSATGTWAAQTLSWAQQLTFQSVSPVLIVLSDIGGINFIDKTTSDILGIAATKTLESGLIDVGAQLFNSPGNRATLLWIDAEMELQAGTTLEVWVGVINEVLGDASITWTKYTLLLDGATKRIPVRQNGQFFAFRLQNTAANQPFRGSGLTGWFQQRGSHT